MQRLLLLVVQTKNLTLMQLLQLVRTVGVQVGLYNGEPEKEVEEEEFKSKRLIHAVKNKDNVPSGEFRVSWSEVRLGC